MIFREILRDHMRAHASTADLVFPGYAALGLHQGELGLIGGRKRPRSDLERRAEDGRVESARGRG